MKPVRQKVVLKLKEAPAVPRECLPPLPTSLTHPKQVALSFMGEGHSWIRGKFLYRLTRSNWGCNNNNKKTWSFVVRANEVSEISSSHLKNRATDTTTCRMSRVSEPMDRPAQRGLRNLALGDWVKEEPGPGVPEPELWQDVCGHPAKFRQVTTGSPLSASHPPHSPSSGS